MSAEAAIENIIDFFMALILIIQFDFVVNYTGNAVIERYGDGGTACLTGIKGKGIAGGLRKVVIRYGRSRHALSALVGQRGLHRDFEASTKAPLVSSLAKAITFSDPVVTVKL